MVWKNWLLRARLEEKAKGRQRMKYLESLGICWSDNMRSKTDTKRRRCLRRYGTFGLRRISARSDPYLSGIGPVFLLSFPRKLLIVNAVSRATLVNWSHVASVPTTVWLNQGPATRTDAMARRDGPTRRVSKTTRLFRRRIEKNSTTSY